MPNMMQSYTGSECVYQMLKAIWPSTARIHNGLSPNAHITTTGKHGSFNNRENATLIDYYSLCQGIMCYFLYWLFQLPFMLISPQRIRYLFTFKALVVPATWLAIFIWSVVKVPTALSLDSKHAALEGSKLSWAWLSALNSSLGFYATLSVNIPDFTVRLFPRRLYPRVLIHASRDTQKMNARKIPVFAFCAVGADTE
jgi:cytosine/uracil/thiamine/allantoin permease